jgi:sulfur-oxidizing protein SoxZ
MAKKSIRIRAQMKGSVTEVKALMSHSMETGLRKDKKTGEKIPAHFIKTVNCEHKGTNI